MAKKQSAAPAGGGARQPHASRRRNDAPEPLPRSWRLSRLLLSVGAVVAGVVVVIAVAASQGVIGRASSATGDGSSLAVPSAPTPLSLASGRALGLPSARATLVVWEDFQCPLCGEFVRQIEPRLITDFVAPGQLRIVPRDMAFLGPESVGAAAAARCANAQGKFWPYHDYLYWNQMPENSGALNRVRFDQIASAVGLDRSTFDACLDKGVEATNADKETAAGRAEGVSETPTLVLGAQMMPGAPLSDLQYAALSNAIKAAIAASASSAP